jgi:hypothetical protein
MIREVTNYGDVFDYSAVDSRVVPRSDLVIDKNFDLKGTKRPAGWAQLRAARVHSKEAVERAAGVSDIQIFERRTQKIADVCLIILTYFKYCKSDVIVL